MAENNIKRIPGLITQPSMEVPWIDKFRKRVKAQAESDQQALAEADLIKRRKRFNKGKFRARGAVVPQPGGNLRSLQALIQLYPDDKYLKALLASSTKP